MARHYVKTVEDWPGETASRMDAARSKIETMTNMQLLELIGQALGEQN